MAIMRGSYRLLSGYTVGLASLCLWTELDGLLHVVFSKGVAAFVVIVSIASAILFDRWLVSSSASFARAPKEGLPLSRGWRIGAWCIAGLTLAAYGLLWVPAFSRPDITWDGMTYHLPTIHFWAEKGYVHWIDIPPEAGTLWTANGNALFNGYPKGAEVVAFVLSTLSNGKLVNAPNLIYLPLAFFGIAYVARELGAARPLAACAGLLFVTVPTNVGQAASTYVDTAFASSAIAFFALSFALLRSALPTSSAFVPTPLAVATGAALGLALGVKAPALALGPLLGVALFAWTACRWKSRRRIRAFARAGRALVVVGAVGVATGGFWYVRNAVIAGNPMFPVEMKVASHTIFPGVPVEVQIAEGPNTPYFMKPWSTPRRVLYAWAQSADFEWPIDGITEHTPDGYALDISSKAAIPAWPRSIRYQDPRSGGLGFLWLFGAVPAIAIVFASTTRRWRRARAKGERVRAFYEWAMFFTYTAIVFCFFMMMPMRWWARYTLWLFALGLPALAVFAQSFLKIDEGRRERRWIKYPARGLLVLVTIFAFFEFGYALKWDHTPPYFVGPAREYAESSVADFWRALRTSKDDGKSAIYLDLESHDEVARLALTSDAVIAVAPLSVANGPVLGQLSMPPGRRHVIPMGPGVGTDQEAAAKFVEKYKPRYVIWDQEVGGDPPVLLATATRWAKLRTMLIFEFGHDSAPPMILSPK